MIARQGDGKRYNQLIKYIKDKSPNKKSSVVIPASFWYLKGFPLADMDKIMDYFIFMNYDYVGQWDWGKPNTGIGCHVDKRTTEEAIKMIVKSGIDTTKLYGGVANYARSFKLTDTGCTKYGCSFTGPESGAKAGSITKTPGFITENELLSIDKSSRKRWTDSDSNCDIMTYEGGTNWAAWNKKVQREDLENWYKNIGLGGSVLWVENYYENENDNEDEESDIDGEDIGNIYYCVYDESLKSYDEFLRNLCYYGQMNTYIINKLKEASTNLTKIMDDYDNYLDYYDAYTRGNYDSVIVEYMKWIIYDRSISRYFKYNKDGKRIVITPKTKREEQYGVSIYLMPDESVVVDDKTGENYYITTENLIDEIVKPNKTDIINQIKTNYKNITVVNPVRNVTIFEKRYEQPDFDSDQNGGRLDQKDSTNDPTGYTKYYVINSVITDPYKKEAAEDFKKYSNISININAFVNRELAKDKTVVHGIKLTFTKSTLLDANMLFPNMLQYMSKQNITQINNIIDKSINAFSSESPSDLYKILKPMLIYVDVAETAEFTYVEGKKIKAKYEKMEKLKILNIILSIIGIGSMFLGPTIGLAVEAATAIAGATATTIIEGKADIEGFALGLSGILGPIIGGVIKGAKITKIIGDIDMKNIKDLSKFKSIRSIRSERLGNTCN